MNKLELSDDIALKITFSSTVKICTLKTSLGYVILLSDQNVPQTVSKNACMSYVFESTISFRNPITENLIDHLYRTIVAINACSKNGQPR